MLDAYNKSLLQVEPTQKRKSVKKDHGSGDKIKVGASKISHSLVGCKGSESSFVDDDTESMFLNLIAFERFHVGAGNEITSLYLFH